MEPPLPVDVHADVTTLVTAAAAAARPRETGGLLLGWWNGGRVAVRYGVEVPDPHATANSWSRDELRAQAALDTTLAEHEHPWLGYVGDWHSHPAACGPSAQDLAAISRASRQYDQPLVLIIHRIDDVIETIGAHRGQRRQTAQPGDDGGRTRRTMTTPRPAEGPASRSGVRRSGDAYQDLIVWGAAMRVIGPGSRFTQVEMEINGAGNVDDVVLRSPAGDRFGQVKWATTTAAQVDEPFVTTAAGNQKSLLQKLYASYRKLRATGTAPTLELITNRTLDSTHPLLGHVDGRTDLVMPYAGQAGPATDAGKALQAWADHVQATRDHLLEMLSHLIFRTGLTISAERDHVQTLMIAAGLDGSEDALQRGLGCVAGWVTGGKRIVPAAEIRETADRLGLRRTDPAAILVVQAIDTDPHADEATIALDWVDLYDGDRPSLRFEPRDPAAWTQMDRDLTGAAAALENAGWRSTLVRGALRQATFFRVGTVLPAVRNHTLRYVQGSQPWSTDTPKAPIALPQTLSTPIGAGTDLAVAAGVAVNPTTAVLAYIRDAELPVDHLLTILPAAGADDQAVASAGQAVAYAQTIRDLVREDLEHHPDATRIHLFLAGPGGLALLLGHRWNRTRPTIVYEHLGPGRGYTPAFTVGA